MQEVLTLREAAALLRCSPDTVTRRVRAGKLPASKVGRQWRFRRRDLEKWLARSRSDSHAMTDLVVSSPDLVRKVKQADRDARQGKFLSWQDAFKG